MEKIVKPIPGIVGFLISLLLLAGAIYLFSGLEKESINLPRLVLGVILALIGGFLMKGLIIVQPNHSRVLNFFWKICGYGKG